MEKTTVQPLSEVFNTLTPEQKKIFRSRQRLVLIGDIMDMAIVEDLPASKIFAGSIKQKANRIRRDIDEVTKDFAKAILLDGAEMTSKTYAYALYTIISVLMDCDEDDLYDLAKELNERGNK